MSFILEIFRFILNRKKYFLVPLIIFLIIFGGLLVLSQGTAVAPFIYTLFCL